MKLTTHIYLDLLGVVELIENITTVVKDRLGLDKRRSHAELAGKVRRARFLAMCYLAAQT